MFNKIDKLTETEFVEVFGNIFENASWIAVKLYKQKPFYDFNNFKNLNLKYKNKFGFPIIIAVKGKNKIEILANFKKRVMLDEQIELDEAINQVKQIATLRLDELKNKFI